VHGDFVEKHYASLKIIEVGNFFFIKIPFSVHFIFKWRHNLSARSRIIISVAGSFSDIAILRYLPKSTNRPTRLSYVLLNINYNAKVPSPSYFNEKRSFSFVLLHSVAPSSTRLN
jgi:hypothetical protein